MDEKYFPKEIEQKWQKRWADEQVFKSEIRPDQKKYYCLEMLPYPSGRIHMGHVRNYSIGDAIARFRRMRGYNVLYTMGWDAFGLPAENAAIKNNEQPEKWTLENIDYMRSQLKRMGYSYDWSREIASCSPDYYRWNQWFFIKMYQRGLAYKKKSVANWCPECQTVLANEQAEGGVCWRHETTRVIQKELDQWFLRITDYADELLAGLDELEGGWPERVLTMQRNWIGKSEGARVDFPIKGSNEKLSIFTTRIDTIYGANAMVLAPEHPLLPKLVEGSPNRDRVLSFAEALKKQSREERAAAELKKEGIATGAYAINPFNGEELPVWVANFILMEYGTGAIMCVPGHDQRDFDFSCQYGLPVRQVIAPLDDSGNPIIFEEQKEAFPGEGVMINSGRWNGLPWREANKKMTEFAAEHGFGQWTVQFKIRDWGISRQRYWGTPIPIIYCDRCGAVTVPEDQLPVELPKNVHITGMGGSPLAQVEEFVNTSCPQCGGAARRDTDTMDTFVDSNWYYFRYCDPRNDRAPFDRDKVEYWMPVDQYIGGIEHAVLHLIYTRFWTKVMRDLGLNSFSEPVKRLLTQGMVCMYSEKTGRSEKMSKSLGNTVDPDEMVELFGADAVRVYMLFTAPPEKDVDWQFKKDEHGNVEYPGVEGAHRFLARVHRIVWKWHKHLAEFNRKADELEFNDAQRRLRRKTHQTIKRVAADFEERLHFNTMIAALMELTNEIYDFDTRLGKVERASEADVFALKEAIENLTLMLGLFAPHVAEEMWEGLGRREMLARAQWPEYNEELAREESLEIPVQVNGKLRGRVQVSIDASDEEIKSAALADGKVLSFTQGKDIVKVIVVPRKLVNIVVR